mgnify:CR=1 FL=1
MTRFNVCFEADDGANPAGGAAPTAETSENPEPTNSDELGEAGKATLQKLRQEKKELAKQLKAAKGESEATKAETDSKLKAVMAALGMGDDGEPTPEALTGQIQELTNQLNAERAKGQQRDLLEKFRQKVGSEVHNVSDAFALSGLTVDDDDEAIESAITSMKTDKPWLFTSGNGDQKPNPGSTGPSRSGVPAATMTLDEFTEITKSPEYQAQSKAKEGPLYERVQHAVKNDLIT